jgi:serine protease
MDSKHTRSTLKKSVTLTSLILGCAIAGSAIAEPVQRFIIKYKDESQIKASQSTKIKNMMTRLSEKSGVPLRHIRNMALNNRHVINLEKAQDSDKFLAMMKILKSDPNVLSIQEDALMQPNLVPNDTFYDLQWHYHEATGGMNAEAAWDTHDGTGVVVAVLDTGITDHSDLNANVLAGYDFIDDLSVSNDGDGRDADPSDPGDWTSSFNQCFFGSVPSNSSWHGTHVAGTIAAVTDNGQGVAGVAYGAQILPVRVLGTCGGFLSDIADGIIWASGGSVPGVPDNTTPAQIINMSLGGGGACDATYQDAIDIAVANGTTVVVSAGNSADDSSGYRPASCDSVINVAANDREGNIAFYSNFGDAVDVTAPGGETTIDENGVLSTLNDGAQSPGVEDYVNYQGTSMAAPHVAGAAALLYQADPSITPAEVEATLMATARPIPGDCANGCGAGIIDARAAIDSLGPVANVAPTAGFSVSVSESDATFTDTSSDSDGTVDNWSWDFGDGNSSADQNPVHTYAADGTYSVALTVTDNEGATGTNTQDVVINANNVAPISSYTYTVADLTVTFSDGSSDSDGTVDSYSWDFGDGNSSTEQNPVHSYSSGGSYTVSLTVTDNQGSTDTSSQTVSVVAPNVAPSASFSVSANLLDVDFTDSSTDSDGSVDSYSWDFGDGNSSTEQNPSHSYASAGTYSVSLTVTDNEGASDTDSQTIDVTDGSVTTGGFTETDLAPSAGQNLSYTIDVPAGATALDVEISGGTGNADLVINFGSTPTRTNNDCIQQGAGNSHSCNISNPDEGTWFIIVRGAQASSGVQLDAYWTAVPAGNIAPTADFSFTTDELEATFTDASSDSDGSVASYAWDFGDGNSSTAQNPVHGYAADGSYDVTLTVTDDEGASSSDTQTVTVSEGGTGTSGGFTETGLSPARGENLSFTIDVPAGATSLVIDTSGGTGNVDLVVNFGSTPTRTNNDCIVQGAGNLHNCTFTNPDEGTWFIIVRGATASSDAQLDAYWFQ